MNVPKPARLGLADLAGLAGVGMRTRPLRTALAAAGVAVGIAALMAVVGIAASGQADLDRTMERLGTNLLTVTPGPDLLGAESKLPATAIPMISRVAPVTSVSATGVVPDARVYRTDRIPRNESGAIAVLAARTDLPAATGATVAAGTWLGAATEHFPATVLGARAAYRLGIGAGDPDAQVWLGGRWFTVIGILAPVPLAPELDTAALVGWPVAEEALGFDGRVTTGYCRIVPDQVEAVRQVLARTADPEHPEDVRVSRPSDALAARRAANRVFSGLLVGLGAVALLIGGIGVANTMVISVLERRTEIGLRRALGAHRGQVRVQFLAESLLMTALGGAAGSVAGAAVTGGYALLRGWPVALPWWTVAGGIGVSMVIGVVAGLYPAMRAARLSPTVALAGPT